MEPGKGENKAMFFFNKVKEGKNHMKADVIIHMIGVLYGAGLRNLLIEAIDDPEKEWDDMVVHVLDVLLGYNDKEEG